MARARNIKPGIFKNEILGVADPIYTLAFQGLWILADRAGRLEDRPLRIRAEIFPYRDVDIEIVLKWLEAEEFIIRYSFGRNRYIQVINFTKHQNPHKNEVESVIPEPPGEVDTNTDIIGTRSDNIGSTRADSLIPDSLIPDSLIPEYSHAGACVDPPAEKPPSCPSCPIQEIIELYHQTLPELPRVVVMNEKRSGLIRQRWRDFYAAGDFKTREEGIECFRWYFAEKVKPSRFLTGRANGNNKDRPPFLASMEWLAKPTNFAKVVEGFYE